MHRILVRKGLDRLNHMERTTGEVIRYERDRPGELVHVDVKKFGLIPPGGGWNVHGRGFSGSEQAARSNGAAPKRRGSGKTGYAYVHSAVDDNSRLAFSEVHDDETAATTVGFWSGAVAFYDDHGITVSEVISDNGSNDRSGNWARANTDLGITVLRTWSYRPQTNGKVDCFQRTLRRIGLRQVIRDRISLTQGVNQAAAHRQ